MESNLRIALKSLLGVAFCAGTALLLSIFLNDSSADIRLAAPAICLQAVIVTSLYWGRLPGFVGAVTASLTFAIWLFPPIGSLAVHNPRDRMMLILFQLSALGVVWMSPRQSSREMRRRIRLKQAGASVYQLVKERDSK
jgi:K+-sensing histidine kinase KdpD